MTKQEYNTLMGNKGGWKWVYKVRSWAKRNPGWVRVIRAFVSLLQFVLAMMFIFAAWTSFALVPVYGAPIMAGVILTMIAGFFWKGATDMDEWEHRQYEEIERMSDELFDMRQTMNRNELY